MRPKQELDKPSKKPNPKNYLKPPQKGDLLIKDIPRGKMIIKNPTKSIALGFR